MATRTGAPYVCINGYYCDPNRANAIGGLPGCGIFEVADQIDNPAGCDNCGTGPLSAVTLQTNDQISEN